MIESTAGKSSVKRAALFAYAAGVTGILANLFLIAFFALQAGRPVYGFSFGTANDIVGSLGTAFMIPVALALGAWLPDRRSGWITEVQAPIAIAAWMVLSLWLFLVNRWLRMSGALRPRVARFGEFVGAGSLAGYVIVGLGLLLPWMSWSQLVVFGVGILIGLPAWLCTRCGFWSWHDILGGHDHSGEDLAVERLSRVLTFRRRSSSRVIL